jgi:gamma-glutamyltranspeptidase / glutathione hydrolase
VSVACGHPLATQAGLDVARQGGNAVDAAVAAAFALFVLLPDACGVGGDALLLVRAPDGAVTAFNGSGKAPAEIPPELPRDGGGTVAAPGAVAALEDASDQFGGLPFAAALAPAVRLAEEGFPATDWLVRVLAEDPDRLARTAGDWELRSRRLRPGDIVKQPRLGRTLLGIAAEGSRAFYEGSLAEAMEEAVTADGGWLTTGDLAAHRTVIRRPVESVFAGARIIAQPPVTQALLSLMALRALERFDHTDKAVRAHLGIEAIEAAFQHRDEIAVPGSEGALLALDLDIDVGRAAGLAGPTSFTHTTAVSAADESGAVVSMVVSVFHHFGSATFVPAGGFFMNDRMRGFSRVPGSPNAPRAGARPVHTLSPLMVETPDDVYAVATPGADGQVQTLLQFLDSVLAGGASLSAALDAPRWRSADGKLSLERGFDPKAGADLAARGHTVGWLPTGDQAFGATVVSGWNPRGKSVFAIADLRREAWAGAW